MTTQEPCSNCYLLAYFAANNCDVTVKHARSIFCRPTHMQHICIAPYACSLCCGWPSVLLYLTRRCCTKRLNGVSWFSAQRLPSSYRTFGVLCVHRRIYHWATWAMPPPLLGSFVKFNVSKIDTRSGFVSL